MGISLAAKVEFEGDGCFVKFPWHANVSYTAFCCG